MASLRSTAAFTEASNLISTHWTPSISSALSVSVGMRSRADRGRRNAVRNGGGGGDGGYCDTTRAWTSHDAAIALCADFALRKWALRGPRTSGLGSPTVETTCRPSLSPSPYGTRSTTTAHHHGFRIPLWEMTRRTSHQVDGRRMFGTMDAKEQEHSVARLERLFNEIFLHKKLTPQQLSERLTECFETYLGISTSHFHTLSRHHLVTLVELCVPGGSTTSPDDGELAAMNPHDDDLATILPALNLIPPKTLALALRTLLSDMQKASALPSLRAAEALEELSHRLGDADGFEWAGKLKGRLLEAKGEFESAIDLEVARLEVLMGHFTNAKDQNSAVRIFEDLHSVLNLSQGPSDHSDGTATARIPEKHIEVFFGCYTKLMEMFLRMYDGPAGWKVWTQLVTYVVQWNSTSAGAGTRPIAIPQRTFSIAIRLAARLRSHEKILSAHSLLTAQHTELERRSVSSLVLAYSRVGDPSSLLGVLSSTVSEPSIKMLTSLVRAYQRAGDWDAAFRLWSEHVSKQPAVDVYAGAMIAAGFAANGRLHETSEVESWLSTKSLEGVSSRTEVVTTSVRRQIRSMNEAKIIRQTASSLTETLMRMMKDSLTVDEFLCSDIALLWFSLEDPDNLWMWVKAVSDAADVYATWRSHHEQARSDGEFLDSPITKAIASNGGRRPLGPPPTIPPMFLTYDLLLRICVKTSSFTLFDEVLSHMTDHDIPVYRPTVDTLVTHYFHQNQIGAMRRSYEVALRSGRWESLPGYRTYRKLLDAAALEAWNEMTERGASYGYEKMGRWWRELHREGNLADVEMFDTLVEGIRSRLEGIRPPQTPDSWKPSILGKQLTDEVLDILDTTESSESTVTATAVPFPVQPQKENDNVRADQSFIQTEDIKPRGRPMTVLETTYLSLLSLFPPKVSDVLPSLLVKLTGLLREFASDSSSSEVPFLKSAISNIDHITKWIETSPKFGDLSQIREDAWKRDLVICTLIPAILDYLATRRRHDLIEQAMNIIVNDGQAVVMEWDIEDFYKNDPVEWRKALRHRGIDAKQERARDLVWEAFLRGLVWTGDLTSLREVIHRQPSTGVTNIHPQNLEIPQAPLVLLWHLLLRLQHQFLHLRLNRRIDYSNPRTFAAPKRFSGRREKGHRDIVHRMGKQYVGEVRIDHEPDAYDPLGTAFLQAKSVPRNIPQDLDERLFQAKRTFRELTRKLGEGTPVTGVLAGGNVSKTREERMGWFIIA
ncbi:hypothetical protein M427DRAFT_315334 [Gonapodya prolifera JEL478]|uniref:Pentacotripeptide-repeat region of PRORP domain-containing protein n=1 Tax=Gonapodya prolifera (strain JEL478) TaxID=1344416 RepID=A0A139AX43_GONPJ|nr:hypothetical protein M427DRAFT_315334 [Gonapodya prolifera JEL478]|eukprot:KXS21277.1 hypothetical protein M427DRAFT_315334 [Gonapodya prolifera JEL478]